MSETVTLVWLRRDLRVTDNAAFASAEKTGKVIPLYIFDEDTTRPLGAASRISLHRALERLSDSLADMGAKLILRKGHVLPIIKKIVKEHNVTHIAFNRGFEEYEVKCEQALVTCFKDDKIAITPFLGSYLFAPEVIKTNAGGFFKIFGPFMCACLQKEVPTPAPTPKRLKPVKNVKSDDLAAWRLLPKKKWNKDFSDFDPQVILRPFIKKKLKNYPTHRDQLGIDGTSHLSTALHWGEISPRQIWHSILAATHDADDLFDARERFFAELLWREFSGHLLYNIPRIAKQSYQTRFDSFRWENSLDDLLTWKAGKTGYPVVDAGMRELWQTGLMHNRARMICASFLVKHLLIDWRLGEEWFWETLLDADMANNAMSWQWIAGTGSDAAPFFRIFNPTLQSTRFDKSGDYIRRFVPELAALPPKYIHAPWTAPEEVLRKANIELGVTYPKPMIDHVFGRDRAMMAFREMNGGLDFF